MDGRRAGLPLGPQADDYLHVTTGKQARAAAMRAVRKVQSIPESDLADRCCLNECVNFCIVAEVIRCAHE